MQRNDCLYHKFDTLLADRECPRCPFEGTDCFNAQKRGGVLRPAFYNPTLSCGPNYFRSTLEADNLFMIQPSNAEK